MDRGELERIAQSGEIHRKPAPENPSRPPRMAAAPGSIHPDGSPMFEVPIDDTVVARQETSRREQEEIYRIDDPVTTEDPRGNNPEAREKRARYRKELVDLQDVTVEGVQRRIADQGIDETRTTRRWLTTDQMQQESAKSGRNLNESRLKVNFLRLKDKSIGARPDYTEAPTLYETRYSNPFAIDDLFPDDGSGDTEGYVVFAEERGIVPLRGARDTLGSVDGLQAVGERIANATVRRGRRNPTVYRIDGVPEVDVADTKDQLQYKDTDYVTWTGVKIYRGKPPANFEDPVDISTLEEVSIFSTQLFDRGEHDAIEGDTDLVGNIRLPQEDMKRQLETIEGVAQFVEQYKLELAELEAARRAQIEAEERAAAGSPPPAGPPPGTPHPPSWT